ncbi:MAG: hypothetical protein WDA27_10065 [Actinomycetota bacterium]
MSEAVRAKQKTLLAGIGCTAGILVLSLGIMGVPIGVLLQTLFPALSVGLVAASLVLIYRTVRVINFAQLAMGGLAAQLFYELYTRKILPYPIAMLTGVAAGVVLAAVVGIIASTLFFRHPRLVMTVVTIFVSGLVANVQSQVGSAFKKEGEITTIKSVPLADSSIWSRKLFEIDAIPFRVAHVIGLVLLLSISVGLAVFFRKTRVGTAIRASAENSDRASLLGINVKMLQVGVWTLVGLVASVGAVSVMAVVPYSPGAVANQTDLLLPLAAAVLGRLASMPVAFFAAVGMLVLQNSIIFSSGDSALIPLALLVVVLVGLLAQRKRIEVRADQGTSWKAVKEVRPTPREMLSLRPIAVSRIAIMAVGILIALGLPWITGLQTINTLQQIWTTAIVATSLVVLTGWSGQISLGQYAIVAVGAFLGGNMTAHWHIPFLLALPLAGLAGAAVSLIIGIPALRIRGLFLAVTTLAIAIVLPLFLFDESYLGRWLPSNNIKPPRMFFLDFTDSRSMYYLSMLLFLLVAAGIMALRKSRGGRVLIALRDNEPGVQSFGIDVVRTRLTAFAISGFIAALAGALLVHQTMGMDRSTFAVGASIQIFILVVIGGVSSLAGALLGALFFIGGALLFPALVSLVTGVTGLIVLMAIPGGLTQVVFGLRDAVLRVVAMRRHIIVPSLFADYSPEAWEKRLAPLAPASQTQGLAVLKPDQRYSLRSRIFGGAKA